MLKKILVIVVCLLVVGACIGAVMHLAPTGSGSFGSGKATVSYDITVSISHGTYTGATKIAKDGTATVTLAAATDYQLPDSITVTGADYVYTQSTGVVSLSNATGDVTVSATCVAPHTFMSFAPDDMFLGYDFGDVSNGDTSAEMDAWLAALTYERDNEDDVVFVCCLLEDGAPLMQAVKLSDNGAYVYALCVVYNENEFAFVYATAAGEINGSSFTRGYQNLTSGHIAGSYAETCVSVNDDGEWNGRLLGKYGVCYPITLENFGGCGISEGNRWIERGGTRTLVIDHSSLYFTTTLTVTGAEVVDDDNPYIGEGNYGTGHRTIVLGNATGPVTLNASTDYMPSNISVTTSNCTVSGATKIYRNSEPVVLTFVADAGYELPSAPTSVTGASYSYDSATGELTLSSVTSWPTVSVVFDCVPESIPAAALTAFTLSDIIMTGDKIVFDTMVSDADMLAFCQGLATAGAGGTSLYSDGICELVADSNLDGAQISAINVGTFYGVMCGGGQGFVGWCNEALPDMGITGSGWQGLDQDGKFELTADFGQVGYLCAATGWNGEFVGLEKAS